MARPRESEVEDLNLIPLMNLFVTMIPLLLLTAAFMHIGMVSTSIPTQTEGDPETPTSSRAVTANVRMSDKGLNITCSSGNIPEEELKSLDAFVPKKGGQYDLKTFTTVLERIRIKYEKSDTMMLVPDKTSKYKDMVRVMDAARNMVSRKMPLFPVVVVTTVVQ